MRKALEYIDNVSKADEILDLEQMWSVDISDAQEAARIAYNEGLEAATHEIERLGHREQSNVIIMFARDLVRKLKR